MTMFKIILYSFFIIFASALSAQKLMQPNEELTENLKFLGHCDESCSKNIQFLGNKWWIWGYNKWFFSSQNITDFIYTSL